MGSSLVPPESVIPTEVLHLNVCGIFMQWETLSLGEVYGFSGRAGQLTSAKNFMIQRNYQKGQGLFQLSSSFYWKAELLS